MHMITKLSGHSRHKKVNQMKEKAIYVGRFQPFHNGHLHAIGQIQNDGIKQIVIGIGSCQEAQTEKNPFSYLERKAMIEKVLPNVKIIPIPDFNNLKLWSEYIQYKAAEVTTIYTGNNWTAKAFAKTGIKVKKLKYISPANGTIIRNKIKQGEDISKDVPKGIYEYVKKNESRAWMMDIKGRPQIATDGIIRYQNKIVLIERKFPPFGYALPGGFIEEGESADKAMQREIKEEINLETSNVKFVGTYSNPKRDPRGHVISIAYSAEGLGDLKAQDDAKKVLLIDIKEALELELTFDHKEIIKDYLKSKEAQL